MNKTEFIRGYLQSDGHGADGHGLFEVTSLSPASRSYSLSLVCNIIVNLGSECHPVFNSRARQPKGTEQSRVRESCTIVRILCSLIRVSACLSKHHPAVGEVECFAVAWRARWSRLWLEDQSLQMANEGGKSGPDGLDIGHPSIAIQNTDVGFVVTAHTQ